MSLHERYTALLEKSVGSLTIWQNFINENLEGPDKNEEMEKLKGIAKEYCIIDSNHRRSEQAIMQIEEAITDPTQDYNVDRMYEEMLSEQDTEEPTDNDIWQQLFIHEVSIREVRPKKKDNTEYVRVDDSLMCSSSFTVPLDPISKVAIRRPIRNKKCKHVYDQSIYDYIRQSRNRAKCPYMGCKNNNLVPADLLPDEQLEAQITQFLASQAQDESADELD